MSTALTRMRPYGFNASRDEDYINKSSERRRRSSVRRSWRRVDNSITRAKAKAETRAAVHEVDA